MTYTLDWLLTKHTADEPLKYLLFWGHRPEKDGSVGKGCLSQWWPSAFIVDGTTYASAEHWMMAEKARLFNDEETRAKILTSKTPGEAKKLGREVRNFVPETWQKTCFDLVVVGNYHKFSQHPAEQTYLLQTGNRVLVEASPVDLIWGIGLTQDDPAALDPTRWQGTNLLGFALMVVRDRLRA
ncbi:NADAR family protein [Fibrella sp. HMF5335]|uniref:NADAR family protein n=1 Tax=Fibrella rubiginis TaxID=2817060 RepID=A0A939K6A7_9BACT|nr:NADAR family protein [Fibrella rubiginis]MBO0937330.1 NADAR family protein [Fibrella rubiginis]